ncbi:MAG: galactose mutarotase [Clostridia bacterium]|nr:galactose mutarotase [Clostridia bacterium]
MSENLWQIENDEIQCTLSDLGAAIDAVRVRDGAGRMIPVALSREVFHPGQANRGMAGRTIGPCCGRVAGGEIEIDGRRRRLTANEGPNHIHGGPGGAGNRTWRGERLCPTRVRFSLTLPDGLDGYPGNRQIEAEYALAGRALRVRYTAVTDKPTWLGLTNHVYWDLSGRFNGAALDQRLQIAAEKVVFNGPGHLPQAVRPAEGPFDFRAPRSLRAGMGVDPTHAQLALGRGYNNAFLLDSALSEGMGCAARLACPESGLGMRLRTNQPALVLYSGGFLGGGATPGCAVAMEAQHVPDPFHLPGQQPAILRPGETYLCEIEWDFEA